MTDIDVEPVEDVDDDAREERPDTTEREAHEEHGEEEPTLLVGDVPEIETGVPEYVLYGGKGGVGKTTMAAATGLSSAAAGDRTLVVSTDPAHSLSDTFETAIPAQAERIREDIPLYAAEIDPDEAMEADAAMFGAGGSGDTYEEGTPGPESGPFAGAEDGPGGPMGGVGELLGGGESPLESLLGGTMPGADEAAAMQILLQYLDDERFDRVVVDTAPTGHTLRLLELPEVMDTMVGRMLQLRERLSGMFDGLKGMFGETPQDPEDGIDDLRELQDRIERLRTVLTDPALTDFRIVMVPEEMSVMESERLQRQLDEFDIPVETVVVNKVMEPLADVTDEEAADRFVSPDLEHCAFCQRRWEVQQTALTRAQELFQGKTIRRVPLLAEEVRGEGPLRIVASCLGE